MNTASFQLNPEEITGIVNQLKNEQDVTLSSFVLTALNVLLYRYTGQEDTFGGDFMLCNQALIPDGNCCTLVPYHNTINGAEQFTDVLKRINNDTADFLQSPVFAFVKNEEGGPNEQITEPGKISSLAIVICSDAKATESPLLIYTGNPGLRFVFTYYAQYLNAKIDYNPTIYQLSTIAAIAGHFSELLQSIKTNLHNKIGAFNILTQSEKEDILTKFNNTTVAYPQHQTIMGLFEEQVKKTPENVALRQDDRVMSYYELNKLANRLAQYLNTRGVTNGSTVAIIAGRGFDMVVGMYAILKAGGAYVPVDPEYPVNRQEYIIKNSSVTITIADKDYAIKDLLQPDKYVNIGNVTLEQFSSDNPGNYVSSSQLAYTIYTSGSTGLPKGVMIAHHSAVNLIHWVNTRFNIGENDRLLFITSMCFDLSVYDIFGMLACGGSIVIVRNSELLDAARLQQLLQDHKITFWDSVPTTMDYLVKELENAEKNYLQHNLRLVFMSGDWIPVNLPGRIKNYFPCAQVISLGGATEGTVWSNFHPVERVETHWKSIPYGRPLDNNYFYILNEQLQPVPVGVAGELYIGGAGVALGYANDAGKTAYSFIQDPFHTSAGGRMYRTGDLGKMGQDLNMVFIGRKDNQVKINGFRVELGEIEAAISKSDLIAGNVVIAKDGSDGKKTLISYIVPKPGYSRDKILAYLKTQLPLYMVPGTWFEIGAIPITSNGKIDRKKLSGLQHTGQEIAELITPANALQQELITIWKSVLNLSSIGINTNFFDLGGHSLLAVQIMSRVEKITGKKFPISILFQHPTIESLSNHIEKHNVGRSKLTSLVPIKPSGNKTPFYIIHGIGLNVLNFKSLIAHVSAEQPLFGFQAKGLDSVEQPLETMEEIAKHYVSELIAHNPDGPYAIGGYSIGGFIAMEMARQLQLIGREVQFLAIFDTDANYSKEHSRILPRYPGINRVIRFARTLSTYPSQTIHNIRRHFKEPENPYDQLIMAHKSDSKDYYLHMKNIRTKLEQAFDLFQLSPFNGRIHLFKAEYCIHFTKDKQYLGWKKYASQGVQAFTVPGDHSTIFHEHNVSVLGRQVQDALDNVFATPAVKM